ncbi:MAG TPA: hypothetical protein VFV89_08445 [Nocardioides sp.]|uniref:hypothetical protein n=1 Tax=Nocardioides sp. TaxID=35761 RepID=UPI002E2FC91C|nr:hypothetical protein [Nocardioides sp.]HEX5087823.1 hypothetical protein [Nocardioides sp.]
MTNTTPHHGLSDRQVKHLLEAGRLSSDEAARLADGDEAVRRSVAAAVRASHVVERLAAAVRLGLVSPAKAAELADRARDDAQAEHVRRRVSRLARQARAADRRPT